MPANTHSTHRLLAFVLLDLNLCFSPKLIEESMVRGNIRQKVVPTPCRGSLSFLVFQKICSLVFFWGFLTNWLQTALNFRVLVHY